MNFLKSFLQSSFLGLRSERRRFSRRDYLRSLKNYNSSVREPTLWDRRRAVKGFAFASTAVCAYALTRPRLLANHPGGSSYQVSYSRLSSQFGLSSQSGNSLTGNNLNRSKSASLVKSSGLEGFHDPYSGDKSELPSSEYAELVEYRDVEIEIQHMFDLEGNSEGYNSNLASETLSIPQARKAAALRNAEALLTGNSERQVSQSLNLIQKESKEALTLALNALPVTPARKPDFDNFTLYSPGTKPASVKRVSVKENTNFKSTSLHRQDKAPENRSGEEVKTLSLFSVNTGEKVVSTFVRDGKYVQSELKRLNWLMRDRRTGDKKNIDPQLYELMHRLAKNVGAENSTINIISGYRSKSTNNMLRRRSNGVASNSYHTKGKAVDISIPGIRLSSVHKEALKLSEGGVGYYPGSNFVHIDTGPIRNWPFRYRNIAKRYQKKRA